MARFLRVVELNDGRWACRFGHFEYDTHAEMDHAVDHIKVLAVEHKPAELFLHRIDGSVHNLGTV